MYLRDFIKYKYEEKGYLLNYCSHYFNWCIPYNGCYELGHRNYKKTKMYKVYLPKVITKLINDAMKI